MCLHHLIDVVQSETEAGDAALAVLLMDGGTAELVEDNLLLLLRDADAVVAHLQQDVFVGVEGLDADLDVILRVFDGIVNEVGDGLREILLVGQHVLHLQIGGDRNGFGGFCLGFLHEVVDDGLDVDVPLVQDQFLVLQLRDSQQLVYL